MDSIDLAKAIKHLKPNSEFVFKEADYSTIEWVVLDGAAPTLSEIEEAHLAVKATEEAAIAAAQQKREAALAKLAALGLEADDLKALGF